MPPPGVCRPGFAGVVEVLRPPFFKDMGHCCGNSSLGKHVSIFLETSVLYEEIVSVVFLGREILLVRIPVCQDWLLALGFSEYLMEVLGSVWSSPLD